MWVAVIGSCKRSSQKTGWSLHHENYFVEACRAIGANLAKMGHELVVARTDSDTADKFTKQGFEDENRGSGRLTKPIYADYPTKIWAQAHLKAVQLADAVIAIGGAEGTYTAAQAALLSGKILITISCFGGAAESIAATESANQRVHFRILSGLKQIVPGASSDWIAELNTLVNEALSDFPRILIIHGRSDDKYALRDILVSGGGSLAGLPKPIIMKEHTQAAPFIHRRFEELAEKVDAAIAVVTPDDMGIDIVQDNGTPRHAIDVRSLQLRARQNVWIEVGWFWGRLGMERVMVLQRGGNVDIPSDLKGMNVHEYADFSSSLLVQIERFVASIRNRAH